MSKTKDKNAYVKKVLIWIAVILTISIYLTVVMPGTKRIFPCYALFRVTADHAIYPKNLPQSASQLKYYVYETIFTDISGYRAIYSVEDYDSVKWERREAYDVDYPWECHCYDGQNKKYIDQEQMKERGILFVDELVSDAENISQYYFLGYSFYDDTDLYCYEGVLCNDESCEIIEFAFCQYRGEL